MDGKEFLWSVLAVLAGLIVAKLVSRHVIARVGVPIAAGNPVARPLTS